MSLLNRPSVEPAGDPASWGARHAHDPTVVRGDDGTWYMFSTDSVAGATDIPSGVHVRTSTDLVTWTFTGTALDGVPKPAFDHTGAAGLWAPEVVRWPGSEPRWHMYYSASTFGSNTSAIGLAVASDLAGPWTDRGIVVATRAGETPQNAIDAAVTFDRNGSPWLTYGSFFSGIHTLRLDPATGLPDTAGDLGAVIARRPRSVDTAIEGAYVVYRSDEDRFVLFVSYDSLFSSYHVRVAVSDEITGPYLDANGRSMTDLESDPHSIGTKVLGSYRFAGDTGWLAPGHNSLLTEPGGDGDEYFLVHHVRFAEDPSEHVVQLRRVFFTDAGWPVVSPQPFAGAQQESLAQPVPVEGVWNVLRLEPGSTDLVDAVPLPVSAPATPGLLSSGRPERVRLLVAATELDAVVFGSWDWAAGHAALSFAGLDADGVAWQGTAGTR